MTNASIPLEEVVASPKPISDVVRTWRSRASAWVGAAFERESLARRFIAAVPYTFLLLFMEYATERWKVSGSVSARVWAGIFHSELLIVAFIFFVPFLAGCFRRHYLLVFSLFYAICVVDFIAWFTINRPVHLADLIYGPEMIRDYSEFIGQLGRTLLLKFAVLLLAPFFIWAFDSWSKRVRLTDKLASAMPGTFFGLAIVYALAFPLVYDGRYFGHNSLVRIGADAIYQSKIERLSPDRATVESLLGPVTSPPALLASAAARHKNVIVFIIETGMAGYYPDLPRVLIENGAGDFAAGAFASEEHYTTYPESDRAIFSILVGQYPPLMKGWMTKPNYDHSLGHVLEQQGYATYMVSTAPLEFHDDIVMVRNVGFDHIIQVTRVKKAFQIKNGEVSWDRSKLYAADMELLDSATSVIAQHASGKPKPYLLVLAPQSSHAPFERPPGSNTDPTNDAELIKANAFWQYKLIEGLIRELRRTGELENTMLVVTGDHGVRSVYETSQLFGDPSLLHRISFHVPFWILNSGKKNLANPTWATSHIDVTPTILQMLDLPYAAGDYHGRSMTSPTPRTVFFFGGEFVSPNGFKVGERFYMENRLRHVIRVRNDFNFGTGTSQGSGPGLLSAADVDHALVTIQSFLLH
jgi:hypothetical protein